MTPDTGRAAFVVAVLVVLGWFAIGTHVNVRRGHAVLRWLKHGLPLLGPRTTLRWLGSSAIELKVPTALEPLHSAEVVVVLEPRDLPLVWWFFHARGRRDVLIVRAELPAPPPGEFEILDSGAWTTRGTERAVRARGWSPLPLPLPFPLPAPVPSVGTVVAYGTGSSESAARLLELGRGAGLTLVRLGVHRTPPHLEVHWTLAGLEGQDARGVVGAVRELARSVATRA